MSKRELPNILITGTPGTGKTTLAVELANRTGLAHLNISELVQEKKLHTGRDEEFDTLILDEDLLCDDIENQLDEGGIILDFHSCDFFPERWFDLVLVLTTDNTTLYDRLAARHYSQKKIRENIECEIMQVIVEEATSSYAAEIVQIMTNTTMQEYEMNLSRISQWLEHWKLNNA